MSKKKSGILSAALVSSVVEWADLFLTAWFLMLMLGALLGNAGLWTPAYWETFGSVFTFSIVVNYATRRYYNMLKVMQRNDALRAARGNVVI